MGYFCHISTRLLPLFNCSEDMHIVSLQICQGDTCSENCETTRGFTERGTNQAGKKKSLVFGKKILLNHKASWHLFGTNNTRDRVQTLERQHSEAVGVVSGMIMAQGRQHSPKQRFRSQPGPGNTNSRKFANSFWKLREAKSSNVAKLCQLASGPEGGHWHQFTGTGVARGVTNMSESHQ